MKKDCNLKKWANIFKVYLGVRQKSSPENTGSITNCCFIKVSISLGADIPLGSAFVSGYCPFIGEITTLNSTYIVFNIF